MKTNKSYAKRVKVTKNGKILVRKAGINHFNAKMSRSTQLNNKSRRTLVLNAKAKTRFLTGVGN
jgi:ribosomal protein L35